MAPPKSRTAPDDSRPEPSSTREKLPGLPTTGSNGKRSRNAGAAANHTAVTARDLAAANSILAAAGTMAGGTGLVDASNGAGGGAAGVAGSGGIQWSTLDADILQGYRQAYRLNTPAAFGNPYNQYILSSCSIGRMSPTMARRREQRRQSKEQLANACRKHFNGLGIQENDAVVDFLYKVKWQDKNFRMRFAPQRPRRAEPVASTAAQPGPAP